MDPRRLPGRTSSDDGLPRHGFQGGGFVLLLRLAYSVVPEIVARWGHLLLGFAMATMLYGSFAALAQRSVKRSDGLSSSIANAGYLLAGYCRDQT